MVKRFIIAIVFIVIVCGGLIGFNMFRSNAIAEFFATMQPPPQTVSATAVEAVTWQPGIEAIGTAKAYQGVDVSAEVGGVVKSINFVANQEVKAGDVLVQIDDAVERADLSSARAAVVRDEAALDREQQLKQRGVLSNASQALAEAIAALDASRGNLQRIEATLDQKSIDAPFAGIIGIPKIDLGEYLETGQMIATLQNVETMRVDFSVPEQLVDKLGMGQVIRVGVDLENLTNSGHIIGIEPKTDAMTRLIAVRAEVDNADGSIRPGQFVRVRVELPEEPGVLSVPQTAVIASLYGDYVYTAVEEQKDGETRFVARQVFVKIGRRNSGRIEIVEGLKEGDQVVTSGQNKIDVGSTLVINNSIDPAKIALGGI
jgi:membrane fusion protein (multidrug efflux system)